MKRDSRPAPDGNRLRPGQASNRTAGHRCSNRMSACMWIVLAILACVCSVRARAADAYRDEMKGLDEQVQDVKSDVLSISTELTQLEEKLLYPSDTQVAVFVRLATGDTLRLDAVHIQIDGRLAADYIYSYKELEALQKGGVQRIYTGNIATGQHQIEISMSGKLASGKDYSRTDSFAFTKAVRPKLIGVTLAGPGAGQSIHVGDW